MPGELDPRLADPDQYFSDKYGSVEVQYGEHLFSLSSALEVEKLLRSQEVVDRDSREKRANTHIKLLREAGALEPEDDVVYPEVT